MTTTTIITEIENSLKSLIGYGKMCQDGYVEGSLDWEYWRGAINTCEVIQLRINESKGAQSWA
jgi:hypothetical protein